MTGSGEEGTPPAPAMAAVAAEFGLAGRVIDVRPVARAWSNRVFRIRTTAAEYAVKQLLNPWREPGWLDWLQEAAAFELRAWQAGLAMPEPITTAAGAVFADVEDDTAAGGVTVRVHRWVHGRPCPAGPMAPADARRVGEQVARMHLLGHRPRREDVFPVVNRGQVDCWASVVLRLAPSAPGLAAAAAAAQPTVEAIGRLLDDADTDASAGPMSHGDVDQKNIVLAGSGPVLCDWDVAAPWIPRQELARTALSLADRREPAVARAVVGGYDAVTGTRHRPAPPDLAVDLVIGLDWLVLCLDRAAGLRDDGEQRRREAAEAAPRLLAELADRLHQVLEIEAWLAG